MNAAEGLARQIRRVAELRGGLAKIEGRFFAASSIPSDALLQVDVMLDQACTALGGGDPVAIAAAGQQLEEISE